MKDLKRSGSWILNVTYEAAFYLLCSHSPIPLCTPGKPPWSQFNNNVTTLYHIACTDILPMYPSPASVELITFLNVRTSHI